MKHSRKTAGCRGSMLVELSLAVTLLLFISLWAFRTNMQTIRPRNWAMVQTITDAYMTRPLAEAESVDFNTLLSATSNWPTYPSTKTTTNVTIGSLPTGNTAAGTRIITGTLVQTKQPATNNISAATTTNGTVATNPARIESWLVQSHLTYTIAGRDYIKSRSTVRTR